MAGEFTLDGLTFRGINGGPEHAGFTETISFSVTCRDQAEVDHYWDLADRGRRRGVGVRLAQGPVRAVVADRPDARLYELMEDPDPARATAATEAMLRMRKIVVAELEAAADAVAPARVP